MIVKAPPILFFTGTDTDVGKTYVASLTAKLLAGYGMKIGVYKPVASGCDYRNGELVSEDALGLWQSAGRPESLERVCPQRFAAPLAPPSAAALENRIVDKDELIEGAKWWYGRCSLLIVEGAGGLFSPLADRFSNADLAYALRATLVLVAENRLGVIHQVVATTLAAKHFADGEGLNLAGIILNQAMSRSDASAETNLTEIRKYCHVPLLGSLPYGSDASPIEQWLRKAC
ncbi:ATP-dependent dethiobiotin synthetase BioD 1 [Roseimaritima multifibrata]|uniref:ATP-dependent dethiobiotin synthetase BioD n=1 Tax=Roseimaritima multifibrata TaxID=1930274 RepID=A0A517MAY5_9BACT|nr:dethiobiotin synthase [Roseimaritima multifibrata]QDS92049.1 ATP-dependent dethiobiotin synthetase BioD 1 [Roseimaritima multifibrata]